MDRSSIPSSSFTAHTWISLPFNEVYDTEHVPFLSQVPGVISVRRYQREELTMNIGGQRQRIHPASRGSVIDGITGATTCRDDLTRYGPGFIGA